MWWQAPLVLLDLGLRASNAKVTQRHLAQFIVENISRFDIPVQNVSWVDVVHGAQAIVQQHLQVIYLNLLWFLKRDDLSEVGWPVIHNKEETLGIFEGFFGVTRHNNIIQTCDKIVLLHHRKLAQNCDFTYQIPDLTSWLKWAFDQLDSHFLRCLTVLGKNNFTKAAFPKDLHKLVFSFDEGPVPLELWRFHEDYITIRKGF